MRGLRFYCGRAAGWFSLAGVLICITAVPGAVAATNIQGESTGQDSVAGAGNQIRAESPPYRIEWDGTRGVFIRQAFAQEPAQQMPLVYMHTDLGPNGYATHLAWFLARDKNGFALLWCYLNDAGSDFWCWLYQFPANRLSTLHFIGNYQFTPLAEPVGPTLMSDLDLHAAPDYTGPNFTYRDWSPKTGALAQLALSNPKRAVSGTGAASPAIIAAPVKVLSRLQVMPLHEIDVGSENGWRAIGWRELHTLAFDSGDDPYYLILYTNSTHGYAVDLKRAQTYIADFGERVRFAGQTTTSPEVGEPTNRPPQVSVARNELHEITLTSTHKYDNPYTEVNLDLELHDPTGKSILIPGFWDGGNTWRMRFTPTLIGDWTWVTHSKDPDLDKKEGGFDCVAEEKPNKGFVQTRPNFSFPHHFMYADGSPFFPSMIRDPVQHLPAAPAGGVRPAAMPGKELAQGEETVPASFTTFKERVDASAALGINRFIGGYLLDKPGFAAKSQVNEGGAPFVNYGPDHLNPAYFQWMDRRIRYCNARGIVPDIGLGWPDQGIFNTYSDEQLRRMWRYILARYAAFDVCWDLFGRDDTPLPPDPARDRRVVEFGQLTRLYDPYHHPLTTLCVGPLSVPKNPASVAPQGGDTGHTHRPSVGGSHASEIRPGVTSPVAPPPFADQPWLDVITQLGGDLAALDYYWSLDKPLVLMERAPAAPIASNGVQPAVASAPPVGMSPDVARLRMWETRMRGGYWAGGRSAALEGIDALSSPEVQAATLCARFFRDTRFWRLEPHPELLRGPDETPEERRRRRQAEANAEKAAPGTPMPAPEGSHDIPPRAKPESPPVFVLADPGKEYVVYFEQGGTATLDLVEATGNVRAVWFNPRTGTFRGEQTIKGGGFLAFTAPDTDDWVLYLLRL